MHKWKDPERDQLRAELDAAYFILYGISRDDAAYVLSTFQGMKDDEAPELPGVASGAADGILGAYDELRAEM